jgi:hypothetical protein
MCTAAQQLRPGVSRPGRGAERKKREHAGRVNEKGTKSFIVGVRPSMLIYMIQLLSSVRGRERVRA